MNEHLLQMYRWGDIYNVTRGLIEQDKGNIFEVLTMYIFKYHEDMKDRVKNVWHRVDVPKEIKEKYGLIDRDIGIDMIVEMDEEVYAVQCKYISNIKKISNLIRESKIVTFRKELERTGLRGILVTNMKWIVKSISCDDDIIIMNEIFNNNKLDYKFFKIIHDACSKEALHDSNTIIWIRRMDMIENIINEKEVEIDDEKTENLNIWYSEQVRNLMTHKKSSAVKPHIKQYWLEFYEKNKEKIEARDYSNILGLNKRKYKGKYKQYIDELQKNDECEEEEECDEIEIPNYDDEIAYDTLKNIKSVIDEDKKLPNKGNKYFRAYLYGMCNMILLNDYIKYITDACNTCNLEINASIIAEYNISYNDVYNFRAKFGVK